MLADSTPTTPDPVLPGLLPACRHRRGPWVCVADEHPDAPALHYFHKAKETTR